MPLQIISTTHDDATTATPTTVTTTTTTCTATAVTANTTSLPPPPLTRLLDKACKWYCPSTTITSVFLSQTKLARHVTHDKKKVHGSCCLLWSLEGQ